MPFTQIASAKAYIIYHLKSSRYEIFHLAELAHFKYVLRVEQHDVLLFELLDAIDLLCCHVYVCVQKHGYFATELVKLADCTLERVESLEDPLSVHVFVYLNDDPELIQTVRREQIWLQLKQTLKEHLEPRYCFELNRHYFEWLLAVLCR